MRHSLLLIASAIILFAACKSGKTVTPSQTSVMFVNAISTGTTTPIEISGLNNNNMVLAATSVNPLSCSAYLDLREVLTLLYR